MPVPPREALAKPDISAFSPKDIIRAGVETERLEVIPLNRILTDSSLIDVVHADELGNSMREKRGQITPIAVRARINDKDGEITYDIIDGFHRTAGKKGNGDTAINATVIYGCSEEEMYDLRILAASSVRSVQFARIAEWITSSFAITQWAAKGLSVSQAFGMVVADRSRSNLVEMNQEEMKGLKEWVNARCTRWGKTPSSIHQDLRVVANADPGLVKEVRIATGGSSRKTRISPVKLALVVNAFPGNLNHGVQREILHFAISNKLKMDDIRIIVENLRDKIKPGLAEEDIKKLINNVQLDKRSSSKKPAIDELNGNVNGSVDVWWNPAIFSERFAQVEMEIAHSLIAEAVSKGQLPRDTFYGDKKLANQRLKTIENRLRNFEEDLRRALVLKEVFELSIEDIAKVLNKDTVYVATAIHFLKNIPNRQASVLTDGRKPEANMSTATSSANQITSNKTPLRINGALSKPSGLPPTTQVQAHVNGSEHAQKKPVASVITVPPKPLAEKASRPQAQAPKVDVKPSSGKNGIGQPKESVVTTPTVIFNHKDGPANKPAQDPPPPEHLDRKPEDFVKGEKVWFLNTREDDRPGIISGTEFKEGRWYVKIDFPPMRHRDIFTSYTSFMPITQFDNRYKL